MHRLQPASQDALRRALAQAAHGSAALRTLHRLHAVLLVSIGRSCYEVAGWFGDDPRSVQRWVHAYELRGPEGLCDAHSTGRPGRLTPKLLAQLAHELDAAPRACGAPGSELPQHREARWTGKLLARHLEQHYGVLLGDRQCQRLLQQRRH